VARHKKNDGRFSAFKGREARLNRAIFQSLALKGPQTIYDIYKQIRTVRGLRYTRYATVNKRVKALEEGGYIRAAGSKKTKAGFETSVHELTARAYLAMLLNSTSLEDLIMRLDEERTEQVLGYLLFATKYSGA
jgi:hypothetical protein